MQAQPTAPRCCTRRVLLLHVSAVALAAAVALMAAMAFARSGSMALGLLVASGLLAVIVFSTWKVSRLLRPSEVIERLLAGLAPGLPEAAELPTIAVASPAAEGWNQIAQSAKRWFALNDLLESVTAGLSSECGSTSQGLLEAIPDGVAATDESSNIVTANPAFASICQTGEADELCGKSLLQACGLTDEARQQFLDAPARKRVTVEFASPSRDGSIRSLRLCRTPRCGQDGEPLGHVWLLRDATQQRLADDMRDKFLAAATHELRTPLANLCAYAESLSTMEGLDVEEQKGFYNIIRSESLRLSQLIDDLLDVSRMQAGAMTIESRKTDLARLVEEVSEKVAASMRSKNIEFCRELPPKYPAILADKSKIAAALVNLLGNATKYTPEGGKVTFRVDAGERRVEFSVADTGIGIGPEELSKVFDRFFRSEDDRVRDIPGSGLGLSLTREIARLHGGDLTVTSELNVGSIFKLTLPLNNAD